MKLEALSSKPKRWRVENSLICYILGVALQNIIKDMQGFVVEREWVALLERDSGRPFEGMNTVNVRACAREVAEIGDILFREIKGASTFKEMALVFSVLITKLTTENRIDDVSTQGVLVANAIMLENAEDQSWGSLEMARRSADALFDLLVSRNYFSCKSVFLG